MINCKKMVCVVCTMVVTLGGHQVTKAQPAPSRLYAPGVVSRFSPDNTEFNWENAYLLQIMSEMAYPDMLNVGPLDLLRLGKYDGTNPEHVAAYRSRLEGILRGRMEGRRWREGWGFDTVTHFGDFGTDTEGYIASNDDFAVVVFRGTEFFNGLTSAGLDMITNLDARGVRYGIRGARVQNGSLTAARSVGQEIEDQLREEHDYSELAFRNCGSWRRRITCLRPNPAAERPIWVTGNSLGAAVATMSSYVLKTEHDLPVMGCYNSASPMVGNARFATAYQDRAGLKLFRFVNNCDVVTRWPGALLNWTADLDELTIAVAEDTLSKVPNIADLVQGDIWQVLPLWQAPLVRSVDIRIEQAKDMVEDLILSLHANFLNYDPGLQSLSQLADEVANSGYVHFGSFHYFNNVGFAFENPSSDFVFSDWIDTHVEEIRKVFVRIFVPKFPEAPTCGPCYNPFDAMCRWCDGRWTAWAGECIIEGGLYAGRMATYFWYPDVLEAQLKVELAGHVLGQSFADHETVEYTRHMYLALLTSPDFSGNPDDLPQPKREEE